MYWKWNAALEDYFFRNSRPDQRILLYLDRKLVEEIGRAEALGGWAEFCEAVRKGPLEVSFPHYIPDLIRGWAGPAYTQAPLFLNGIAVLVLAWTERPAGEIGYYEALRQFGQDHLGGTELRKEMVQQLVDEFERVREWSQARPEVPGTFADEPIQGYRYVGRIRHHALVSPKERDNLHFTWRELKLEPGAEPDVDWLAHLLVQHRPSGHRIPRLLDLLDHPTAISREAASNWLADEFRHWQGQAPDAPHDLAPRWEEKLELRVSLDRRRGWGLRLFHPEWVGELEVEWKGRKLRVEIKDHGWSDRFLPDEAAFEADFAKALRPVRVSVRGPVSCELKVFPPPFYHPADAVGAFGNDEIGCARPLRGQLFLHLFPTKELTHWKQWVEEKDVENWRERDVQAKLPPATSLYFADQIPVPTPSPQGEPSIRRMPRIKRERTLFPVRTQDLQPPWCLDETGAKTNSSRIQISHFSIAGAEASGGAHSGGIFSPPGKADEIPWGAHLLEPLLARGKSEIAFEDYYTCLDAWAREIDEPLERRESRLYRRETAALGYFLEDPSQQKIQLAPPAFVLFPGNPSQTQFMLSGIWTRSLLEEVVEWCRQPEHGLQLDWILPTSSFFPPTGRIGCYNLQDLMDLHAALDQKFPGVVGYGGAYAMTMLENLKIPTNRGWFPDREGVKKQGHPSLNFALSPRTYGFIPPSPIPKYPVLTKTYHEWMGYPMFTWWENEDHGFECNGEWAVWELLRQHGSPFLFADTERLDQIFLPFALPLPPLLHRALTMASGRVNMAQEVRLPTGEAVWLRKYENIRFPMRRALTRLLMGASPEDATQDHFTDLSLSTTTKPIKNGSIDQ